MTTDWLFPCYLAIIICLLDTTFNNSDFIFFTICAKTSIDCWSYPTKFMIIIIKTSAFYFTDAFFSEVRFYFIIIFRQQRQFIFFQWSTGITILTTAAFALIQIAYKLLLYYIITDQYIVYNYHLSIICEGNHTLSIDYGKKEPALLPLKRIDKMLHIRLQKIIQIGRAHV